jgi:hypothetical protein
VKVDVLQFWITLRLAAGASMDFGLAASLGKMPKTGFWIRNSGEVLLPNKYSGSQLGAIDLYSP